MTPCAVRFLWIKSRPPTPRARLILSKEPLDENALRAAIEATGYHVGTIHSAPYEKKGLFSFFKK